MTRMHRAMRPCRAGLLAGLLAGAAAPALAQEPVDVHRLAQQRYCLACHSMEQKAVGPAFREVAARYAGQPGAAAQLAATIVKGGSGRWGSAPMPPNTGVSPAEARQLADWVLSLPPQ